MTGAGDAGPGVELTRLRAENDALHDALLIANQAQRAAADRADAAERAVEPVLRSFDIGEGGMSADIAGPIVQRLAMAMAVHFRASGAANYIEMGLNAVDAPFERYTVTVQRYGAKSAHMLRAEAEAARDRLSAELAAARVEVEVRDGRIAELSDLISGAAFHFFCCGAGAHTDEDECGQFVPAMADLAKAIGFDADPATNAEIAAVPQSQATARRAARTPGGSHGE